MSRSAKQRRMAAASRYNRCSRKKPYEAWMRAEAAIEELLEKNIADGTPERSLGLISYRCPDCDQWHIGHQIKTTRTRGTK